MTRILAIETSCDETAAAVVRDGRHIESNIVASQIELHRRFGGVFPEVASRQHVLAIQNVVQQALQAANTNHVHELDAIAVTHGPGLAGSLLVGVNMAKGLAFASGRPLIPVNHLEGHVYSNWLYVDGRREKQGEEHTERDRAEIDLDTAGAAVEDGGAELGDRFPVLVLIVSGGHTELVLMHGHGHYQRLGGTLDDAAGEAFDKVARLLDLGFPGGPAIQRTAQNGDPQRFALPRPLLHGDPEHRYNFSFSGLKTAVLNLTRELEEQGRDLHEPQLAADLAASFQEAVADVLVAKTTAAATDFGVTRVCICGGVSANARLRDLAISRCRELALPLHIPPHFLCTDNAAMIGAAAYYLLRYTNAIAQDNLDLDVFANLPLA